MAKIQEAEKILKETEIEKKATVGQLNAINQKIKAQSRLIRDIKSEISYVDDDIDVLNSVVISMEHDLVDLRQEYADMVYSTHRSNLNNSRLMFLFSSASFNELYRKMRYLDQYTKAREKQVTQIIKVKDELEEQKESLVVKKTQKSRLLRSQLRQSKNLVQLKDRQSELIGELSKKAKDIKLEIASKKKSVDKLDNLIASLIKKELEKANAIEKEKSSNIASSETILNLNKLAQDFEKSKARMTWPVETGFVSGKFGEHPHPVFKGVKVVNLGVDIQTNKDASVKPVFKGKVTRVGYIPGFNSFVMVQHGRYYTVYARLKSVNVKQGQIVGTGDSLGFVYTDKEGKSEVQFQVWKENVKLNPEQWLARK